MRDIRSYTVDEANSALPWLRQALYDLRSVQRNIEISGLTMQRLSAHQRRRVDSAVDEDMRTVERAISAGRERLRDIVLEMTERGVELRDLSFGLVDFPGERDGRAIWLCWKTDEPEVGHWHELGSGFASRQPL